MASAGIISGLMGEWHVARTRIDQFIRPDLNLIPASQASLSAGGGVLDEIQAACFAERPSRYLRRLFHGLLKRFPRVGTSRVPISVWSCSLFRFLNRFKKKADVSAAVGLLVMQVESGGPADLGGALLGDILLGYLTIV